MDTNGRTILSEDYVSYEVAKLLKEKGFNIPLDSEDWLCCMYDENGNIHWGIYDENWYFRITHQMAIKWLREIHDIFIYIEPFITTSGLQGYKPYCTKIGVEFMWINPLRKYNNTSSDTYEEAVEAALKYCLENLI